MPAIAHRLRSLAGMHLHPTPPRFIAALLGSLLAASAWGQALPSDPLARRCWLGHTAERTAADLREPMAVRFSNLRTGYALRSPFWVDFGVRGMGVIPAGNKNERAGHHHILIDTPLPSDHRAAIPFSNTHKHFGKGQTGAELDLPEGKHTLRLLFADHEHKPYFVFSREITVDVVGRRTAVPLSIDPKQFEASCAAWYQDQISAPRSGEREAYVKNLRSEEPVTSPFVISLGVVGLGVAPAGSKIKDTGHFALNILRGGAQVQRLLLNDGRTEALLDLPKGDYEAELRFLDTEGQVLLKAAPLKFTVTRQDR
jgi:hypothetical protein